MDASFIAFLLSRKLRMHWKIVRFSWQAAEIGIDHCWIQSIAMTTAHGENHYGRVDRKTYRNDGEAHAAAGVLRQHQAEVRRATRPQAELPTGGNRAVHVRSHGRAVEVRSRSLFERGRCARADQ